MDTDAYGAVKSGQARLLYFEMGCRGFKTASKLWSRIRNIPQTFTATDHWPVYAQLIHPEQHLASKALTYTVEGFNSLIRHYLVYSSSSLERRNVDT